MATDVTLPPLGENVEEGVVVAVSVAAGDRVEEGQSLLEIETDKVTMEVPAERAGRVEALYVEEGDTTRVGEAILVLNPVEEGDAPSDGAQTVAEEGDAQTAPDEEPAVPAASEPPPDEDPEGPPDPSGPSGDGVPSSPQRPARSEASETGVRASPLARKVAREIGVDIERVPSGSKSGRVSVEDVKAFARDQHARSAPAAPTPSARPLPDFSAQGNVQREPFSSTTAATSQNMTQAWSQIPHAWLDEEVDVTTLEAHRQRHKERVEAEGGALTVTSLLVYAVARALRAFPRLNASVDVEAEEIVYKDFVHVGVAVDTERGLLVPVLHDADEKSLTEISRDLTELSEAARRGDVALDDLEGATFTVSNLGGIGASGLTPLVNWPQVAILGAASARTEPRYEEGSVEPRRILPLTLGVDHRVINGADGARFLQFVKERLEAPFLLNL
jgi:pyruvate dehydrogenase E2 component (dihydrolipoamide acetyltransferase)